MKNVVFGIIGFFIGIIIMVLAARISVRIYKVEAEPAAVVQSVVPYSQDRGSMYTRYMLINCLKQLQGKEL